MRAQNRLIAFAARYVSVTTSTTSRFGLSAKRTLILPGDVRYELDLSKLQPGDVKWDGSSHTLSVKLPEIEIAGPDVDLNAVQEYGAGGVLSALTNADQTLDQANRAGAVADLRKQALGRGADAACPPGGAGGDRAELRDAAGRRRLQGRRRSSRASRPRAATRLATWTFRPHMRRRSRRPSAAARRNRNDRTDRNR